MYLLCFKSPPHNSYSKALKPHFPTPLPLPLPPPSPRILFRMKDRPPSSYGPLYVPPHHRRSGTANVPATTNSRPSNATTNSGADNRSSFSNPKVYCYGNSIEVKSYPYLPPHHSLKQVQQQKELWRHDEAVDQVPQREVEISPQPSTTCLDNISAWKWKLNTLLYDADKHEVVSREKKDRRDFEQIADLASSMGLYSHMYTKVVVVSKDPLPNYRFDLDDKRPLREVILPPSLQMRVDAYLVKYISGKCKSMDAFPRLTSNASISDESLFEQPDPIPHCKAAMEKTSWQRSLQMHDEQHAWQESTEGRKIMKLRHSLPAYKEKEAILNAISQNQVVIISGETGCGKTTQIPQFILESEIDYMQGAKCNVICTQPRRISAMSVSERIATERGEKLGETVGYKVRLEGMKGKDTHLLFCTTGILLRRLSVDGNLKGVTHIIVDEIHERGINEDFLLIVLKDLLLRRPDLRLILMSATLDANLFSSYFGGAPVVQIPVGF